MRYAILNEHVGGPLPGTANALTNILEVRGEERCSSLTKAMVADSFPPARDHLAVSHKLYVETMQFLFADSEVPTVYVVYLFVTSITGSVPQMHPI